MTLNHWYYPPMSSRPSIDVAVVMRRERVQGDMAMFLGHIYMGTIGMQGAYSAMRTGYVDETWAKEHHELWYNDIKAGKIPAQRSPEAVAHGGPTSTSASA